MNLMWEKTMNNAVVPENVLWDIKPTPDGNWVAVGYLIPYIPEDPEVSPWQGGVLHKFSPEGDSIWTVLDTAFYHPLYGLENKLGGAAVLPSGSVVAVGYANSFDGADFKSWAWVLKVDKDGCVDTLCTVVGSGEASPMFEPMEVRVSPNPASETTQIHLPRPFAPSRIRVFNLLGQLVYEENITGGTSALSISVPDWPSGAYMVQVEMPGLGRWSGKLLVVHGKGNN